MPTYKYRAKKGPDQIVESTVDALSEADAIEMISRMGYVPIRVELETQAAKSAPYPSSMPRGRVKPKEITIFSRQLASLLKAGVPILNAIDIISEQLANPVLRYILGDIHNAVKEGVSLSGSIEKYPDVFSHLYIAMVRTGEDSGTLPEVLFKISDYRAKQEEMLSRFRMALAYPVFMAAVGIATVAFMLIFVMPRLMGIFSGMSQNLPLPTVILISISQTLRRKWWLIAAVLVVLASVVRRYAKTKPGRWFFSALKLRLPFVGGFILRAELSRFSRTLELLVKSSVPILRSIDVATPVLENEVLKNLLSESYKELERGGSLGRSLKGSKIFPVFMTNLIIVGEESGKLDEALAEVANAYERDTDEAMRTMASLIEPAMILGMGLIVGFIVVAMLLPIFEINMMAK